MNENNSSVVYFNDLPEDNYPIILDYDFINKSPRGGSLKLDFFSYGTMQKRLDPLELNEAVFYRHMPMLFERGVFLLDFENINKDMKKFLNVINNLKSKIIYIEKSTLLDANQVNSALSYLTVKFIEFT